MLYGVSSWNSVSLLDQSGVKDIIIMLVCSRVGGGTTVPLTSVPLDECPPGHESPRQVSPQTTVPLDTCPPRTPVPPGHLSPQTLVPPDNCPPRTLVPPWNLSPQSILSYPSWKMLGRTNVRGSTKRRTLWRLWWASSGKLSPGVDGHGHLLL